MLYQTNHCTSIFRPARDLSQRRRFVPHIAGGSRCGECVANLSAVRNTYYCVQVNAETIN
jgi:hypothetical protein